MEKNTRERSVPAFNNELKLKGFNVFQIEQDSKAVGNYSRKDFYKICLTTAQSLINYADRSFLMDGTICYCDFVRDVWGHHFPIQNVPFVDCQCVY
jgi:AraC family transcriptional regulator, transcriptional activator of pobA